MNVKGKNVVILGAGISGKGAAELLSCQGASEIHLLGRASEGVTDGEGPLAEKYLERAHLLIKSPGIPWEHSLVQKASLSGIDVVGEADFACSFIKTPLIAVTGTNGKTTTVNWLEEAFRRAGVRVACGGNVGTPVSELVEKSSDWEVLILELSSFQLERIRFIHPEIGVILNITPSHSERYRCFEDYKRAKWGICTEMESQDLLLVPNDESIIPTSIKCRVGAVERGGCPLSFRNFSFSGEHHRGNAAFCVKVLEEFSRRHGKDREALLAGMQETLDNFEGMPHRIESVQTSMPGVSIYNDSKSTNGQSVLAALESLSDAPSPFFLILGGALRGERVPFPSTFWEVFKDRVDRVFFYGEAGKELFERFSLEISSCYTNSLDELCGEIRREGNFKTLLFSPGFPSFDQFDSYMARGDAFKEAFLG